MGGKKTQNSILVLTTLGVYLGLLMVGGAAPQVLAHSATTRNFEIADEIEVKDEIDTDPDEEIRARISLTTYFQDVENFIYTLRRLDGTRYFNSSTDEFDVTQTTQLPCIAENRIGSYTADNFAAKNESIRPWLESFSKLLTDGYSLGDCLSISRFAPTQATDSRFNFHLDSKGLSIEVTVRKSSPQAARSLANGLNSVFPKLRSESDSTTRLRLYETTRFRAKNEQIFVVTRLPRAGLDPLLAKDAK